MFDTEIKIAIFDCETENAPKEPRDWKNYLWMGLSICCVWVSWQGGKEGRYRLFGKNEIERIVEVLERADQVVSFNGKHFDDPLLSAIYGQKLKLKQHIDIMQVLAEKLGHKVGQEQVARATLGEGKTGHGKFAPTLFKEGRWGELCTYCQDDVRLLKSLYFYALEHERLIVGNKWGKPPRLVQLPGFGSKAHSSGECKAGSNSETERTEHDYRKTQSDSARAKGARSASVAIRGGIETSQKQRITQGNLTSGDQATNPLQKNGKENVNNHPVLVSETQEEKCVQQPPSTSRKLYTPQSRYPYKEPTIPQIHAIRKMMGIPEWAPPPGFTRQQASEEISRLRSRR